jgi:hypothetical protein
MEANTKLIQCPHKEHSKHKATLYIFPHKFAGMWDCRYGYSDTHEHLEYEIEDAVEDYYDPGDYYGHGQREYQIYVCGGDEGCGVAIEDADPAEDRAEALADMQIMEARGK